MKSRLIILVLCLSMVLPMVALADTSVVNIYVSPDGEADGSGLTASDPLMSLDAALDLALTKRASSQDKTICINLMDGEHFTAGSKLANMSNTADAPLIIKSYDNANAVITNRKSVSVDDLGAVEDETMITKLPALSKDSVLCISLADFGVTANYSPWYYQGSPNCLVYADGELQTIARWPNDGYAYLEGAYLTDDGAVFECSGKSVENWMNSDSARFFGAGRYLWMWEALKIKSAADGVVTIAAPYGGVREGMPYFIYNLPEELDAEGEYYIDYDADMLYIIPPEGAQTISLTPDASPLITLTNCSNVVIDNVKFIGSSREGVYLSGCNDVNIKNCDFTGLGTTAVDSDDCMGLYVSNCDIYRNGVGGVYLRGGDRNTLTPSGNTVYNCRIYSNSQLAWISATGVYLGGVGCVAQNNTIYDMPQHAIKFGGNDHLIKGNEIYDICWLSNDNGAIYAGRDWTHRGTVIEGNYMHDIIGYNGTGVNAVYLDDMLSGTTVRNNIFAFLNTAVRIHGGRDNDISGNMFIACDTTVSIIDYSGMGNAQEFETDFYSKTAALPCTGAVWREAYPQLYAQLSESLTEAGYPKNNNVYDNTMINSYGPQLSSLARNYGKESNNVIRQAVFYKNK